MWLIDEGVNVWASGGKGEIAQRSVSLENLDFVGDVTDTRIGRVEAPLTVDKEPAFQRETRLAPSCLQGKSQGEFKARGILGAAAREV